MRRRLTPLALLAALVAGGCDGDDRDPRADFLRQADRICLRSGIRPKAVPNDLPQSAALLAEEAELRLGVHAKLAELDPPEDLRADYARFLEATGSVARDLRRMAASARAGRRAELGELGRRTAVAESERLRLGERIGFRRCGRPITDPVRDASA